MLGILAESRGRSFRISKLHNTAGLFAAYRPPLQRTAVEHRCREHRTTSMMPLLSSRGACKGFPINTKSPHNPRGGWTSAPFLRWLPAHSRQAFGDGEGPGSRPGGFSRALEAGGLSPGSINGRCTTWRSEPALPLAGFSGTTCPPSPFSAASPH